MVKYDYMDKQFDVETSGMFPLMGAPKMAMGVEMITTGRGDSRGSPKSGGGMNRFQLEELREEYLRNQAMNAQMYSYAPSYFRDAPGWSISADGLLLFEDEELISFQSMYAGSGLGHLPDEAYSFISERYDSDGELLRFYDDRYIKPEYMESLWVDSPIAPGVQYNPYTHNYRYNGEVFDQRIDRPKKDYGALVELQRYGVTDKNLAFDYLQGSYYEGGGRQPAIGLLGSAKGAHEAQEFNFNRLDYQYEVLDYLVELGVVPPDHPLAKI
jgi:hypothetical protein